jgi:competence protein ComEA
MCRSLSILLLLCVATANALGHEPVPAAGQTPPACAAAAPLNLNSATPEQLDALPGIGPALAARIVAYRDEHGPFSQIEQLKCIKGIGPRTLEKLRPCLTER